MKSILDDTAKKTYSDEEVKNREMFLEQLAQAIYQDESDGAGRGHFRQIAAIDPTAAPAVEVAIIEVYRSAKDLTKAARRSRCGLE